MLRLFLNKPKPESMDGVVTGLTLGLELMCLTSVLTSSRESSALNSAENILRANLVVVSCVATADLNSQTFLGENLFDWPLQPTVAPACG